MHVPCSHIFIGPGPLGIMPHQSQIFKRCPVKLCFRNISNLLIKCFNVLSRHKRGGIRCTCLKRFPEKIRRTLNVAWPNDQAFCQAFEFFLIMQSSLRPNPIYCSMPLVEKSILVFGIHGKYIQICVKLK